MEYHILHQSLIPMGQLQEALILLRLDHLNNKVQMAEPLKWRDCGMGADFAHNEAFILAHSMGFEQITPEIRDLLQAMTDAAWKLGIKPKAAENTESEIKAVRYHLEDMRLMARLVQAPMPAPLREVK